MTRQIKFRGKKTHSHGEWIYGSLLQNSAGTCYIVDKQTAPSKIGEQYQEVVYVGQYTGLKDKNGKKIYEGDIVKLVVTYGNTSYSNICVVKFDEINPSFCLSKDNGVEYDFVKCGCAEYEVIGNIYDNPKMLEENKWN